MLKNIFSSIFKDGIICNNKFAFKKYSFQLGVKLNEPDEKGLLTLDLALSTGQEDLALNLIEHKVRVNQLDSNGSAPLHNAIIRGKQWVAG